MPIEIKITDIKNLTKNELGELITYLKKTWYSNPSSAEENDPDVIKQEIDENFVQEVKEAFGRGMTNPIKIFNDEDFIPRGQFDIPDNASQVPYFRMPEPTEEEINKEIKETLKDCGYELPVKKPRKKRETKKNTVLIKDEVTGSTLGAIEVSSQLESIGRGDRSKDYIFADEIPFTYQEAIAEILERVREKKISFEQINTILQSLNLKTLNDLESNQELITPFMKKMEIEND